MIELTETLIRAIYENTKYIKFFPNDKYSVIHGHGSWAPIIKNGKMIMKNKYITDVDYTNYVKITANQDPADPDTFIIPQKEKERIYAEIVRVLKKAKTLKHVHFTSLFAGTDPRFQFPYTINKTGQITNYDPFALKTKVDQLLDDGAITEIEHAKLSSLIKPNPTLMEFYKLYIAFIEDMGELHWSYDEIIANKKTYRGKTTTLYEQMERIQVLGDVGINAAPFVFGFIIKLSKNVYIPFDISTVFYTIKPNCEESLNKILKVDVVSTHNSRNEEKLFDNCVNLINERTRITNNIAIYEGLYKNYAQYKYAKMLKRLRTLLTHKMFGEMSEREPSPNDKRFLGRIRREISDIQNETTLGALNHLKNRLGTITDIIKRGFEPYSIYKHLVVELIKDIWEHTDYNANHTNETLLTICKQIEKASEKTNLLESLGNLKVELFHFMNTMTKPYWSKYYNLTKRFFAFPPNLFEI